MSDSTESAGEVKQFLEFFSSTVFFLQLKPEEAKHTLKYAGSSHEIPARQRQPGMLAGGFGFHAVDADSTSNSMAVVK